MVTIDAANFEEANDDDTSHFGGTVTISQTLRCSGTDRDSENAFDRIIDAACALLGVTPSDADDEELYNEFYDVVTCKVSLGEKFGISFANGQFTVE